MALPQPLIREAVAAFDDPEGLEQAVGDLRSGGFDRSDISFLAPEALAHHADLRHAEDDPKVPRQAPTTDTDLRQARVLGTSLAAVVAGFAAAGFTVLTGGVAALAAGAAALAAGGVGAAGALIGRAAGEEERRFFREQVEKGGVLLWVRLRDDECERRALDILRRHSAHDVHVHDVPASAPL